MEVYWPIYLVNQWIVLGKPIVSKDQRTKRIKQNDIKVQIHTITGGKNYGQVGNFGDGAVWWTIKQAESNQRSCRCLQVVSIHKFRVYKAVSRSRVDKSSERNFIKVILTKDQRRDKENKEWIRIRKNRCIELDGTHCCTGKFNTALSLCKVLGVTLYFSEGFLEATARGSAVAEALQSLLVVSCTTIDAQVIFKMLLVLVTDQLVITGQLGREVYLWSIGLFLGSRRQRWFWGGLGGWDYWRWICLILGDHGSAGDESFSLLPRVRFKGLFLYLPCTMAFTVMFLVAVINGHH